MITDLIKDADRVDKTTYCGKKRPSPKRTIHTLMGDMRRWSWNAGDYRINQNDYKMLKEYYDEREGDGDDGK